ncbi:MAG TPA: capsid cement protein [Usitatibacteraceae bacterium]
MSNKTSISILALTLVASGAITNGRFVGPAGAQAAAAGNALGVAKTDAAIGDLVAVTVMGTEITEAGAAIAANALVEIDAAGRAVTKAAGVTVGRLAPGSAAGAAGDYVEVILFPN